MAATPPSAGPSSSSPSPTAVRSYLTPVTSLDFSSINTLKALLQITVDVRRSTANTYRNQRGSPGAGALGSTLAQLHPRLSDISDKLSEVLKAHEEFPGMYLVARQLPVFRDVLGGSFNDRGNDPGYSERVRLLEKLMYVSGTLRGHVEMVLEQSAYWRARLAGNTPRRLARRLNFDLAVDPAAVAEPEVGPKEMGPAEAVDAIGRECLAADHTCKVSVNLPQELVAALAKIWEDQKFTDVDFLLGSEVIPAHKAVLAAHSPYFESMLYGSMREASMREIVLEGVPVTAFWKVLQFAYTGSLHMENVPLQDILEVSSVADRFGFVSLKEALGDQLSQSHVSLDTVLLLFVHSDTYHLQQLHKSCLDFIEKEENMIRVLHHSSLLLLPQEGLAAILSRDTFMTPEIEILRAVERWKEHNSKKVGEIATLLDCVRLSEFSSAEEVFQEVEPMGLLDSQTILAGVRVMCKPCLSEMKPRGKIEKNKNLFTNPTVNFDPATRPTIQQPQQQAQLPYGRRFVIAPPTKLCVADTVILMRERAKSRVYQRLPTPSQRSPDTVIVALGDRYIINCLSIKGYPSESDDEQMKDKCFSYTVSISRDKNSWLKLFNYSSFACWGTQNLPFPRQAARFVRLDLKWKYNMRCELPLQFSACCLVSDPRPFAFLPNGVIAPRYDHDVVAMSQSMNNNNEANGQWKVLCQAIFRQPYSISCLRFSLECSDKDIDSVDITVEVGLFEVDSGGEPDDIGVREVIISRSGGGVKPAGGLQIGSGLHDRPLGQVASTGGLHLPQSPASGGSGQEEEDVKLKLKDIDKAPLNDPITLELKEKVVNGMAVHIREVHRKPSPPTTAATEPKAERKSVGGVEDEAYEPQLLSTAVRSVVSSPPVSQVKTESTVALPTLQSHQAPQYPPTVEPHGLGDQTDFAITSDDEEFRPSLIAIGTGLKSQRKPISLSSASQAVQGSAATSQRPTTVAAPTLQNQRPLHQAPQYPPTVQPHGLGDQTDFAITSDDEEFRPSLIAIGTGLKSQRKPISLSSASQAVQGSAATSQQPTLSTVPYYSPGKKKSSRAKAAHAYALSQATLPLARTTPSAVGQGSRKSHRQQRVENVWIDEKPSPIAVANSLPISLAQGSTASPVRFKIVNIVVKSSIQ